jgi:hypothetical protein
MVFSRSDELPRLVLTDESATLSRLLLEGLHLLVRYPQTARALIQAFVAEGRQYSSTPEGEVWRARLAKSQLVRRGRLIWDAYSLDALLETDTGRLPSAWMDIILAGVANSDLETILANLVVEEVKRGTFGPA